MMHTMRRALAALLTEIREDEGTRGAEETYAMLRYTLRGRERRIVRGTDSARQRERKRRAARPANTHARDVREVAALRAAAAQLRRVRTNG